MLKKSDLQMGYFAQESIKSGKLVSYDELPEYEPEQPTLTKMPQEEMQIDQYYYPSTEVTFNKENNSWQMKRVEKNLITISYGLVGKHYQEIDNTVNCNNNGEMLIEGRIEIIKKIEYWETENSHSDSYVCKIYSDVWQNGFREIEVKSEDYRNLFKFLKKKYPEIKFEVDSTKAAQEYLTDVFKRDRDKFDIDSNVEVKTRKTGWFSRKGTTSYRLGIDKFYQTYNIPELNFWDYNQIHQIFHKGTNFLEVGKYGEAISAIFLMGHIAYTNYWLKIRSEPFKSVLYVQGATNLLKTSVVKVISNPFDTNRDNATIRMTSTSAGIRHTMSMSQDTLICVDDFSNTELSGSKKSLENAEDVIRAVGDRIFPVKMNIKDFSESLREEVRVAVILTGEEKLGLGASSQYRMIVVNVNESTFDGSILREFQNNPDIMANYFSLYINFLTEYGQYIAENANQRIKYYSEYYANKFKVRRLIEAISILLYQIDIFVLFASHCGVNENEISQLAENLSSNIIILMNKNNNASIEVKPTIKFLKGLWQIMGTLPNSDVAETEEIYIQNETKYIGFKEGEEYIWLRLNDTYNLVVKYYQKQGENFLVKIDTLKKDLLKEGFSDGKMPENGKGAEYLRRPRKGSRARRMLVLKTKVVEKKLLELNEEEE